MRLVLERRAERSFGFSLLSPILALGLTVMCGGLIFSLMGIPAGQGLYVYFIEPLSDRWSLEQLVLKAAPLALIGAGLTVCYRANVWNIGAEGQFICGAIAGSTIPVLAPSWEGPTVLPAMLVMGAAGGAAYALIPAALKTWYNASEILVSLMLVYVAQLLLDWVVRGPWRDPKGFNFPITRSFTGWQVLPTWGGTLHLGVLLALIACLALGVMMSRTLKGFEITVSGQASRAARFSGFSRPRIVWFCFALSGALSGLAGVSEVGSVIGKLQAQVSPGYGFTAIIVAFVARLNPYGVVLAALLLSLSYVGGEAVQVSLGVSEKIARVFQGLLLFFLLACDSFIFYRLRWLPPSTALKA